MNNPFTTSATRFRTTLTVLIVITILAAIGLVLFSVGVLNNYADEVSQHAVDAKNSESRLSSMRAEAAELERRNQAAERAANIVAESQDYMHQDVIIQDLERFARESGVRVMSYDFSSESSDSTQPSTDAAPAPDPATTTPAAEGEAGLVDGAEASPAAAAPTGPNSTNVNVNIDNPVSYNSLLQFIYRIEQNPTRMQISSISMSRDAENPRLVTSGSFVIKVYIK